MQVGLWSLVEEQGRFQARETFVEAGSEVWVLKHSGAFQMLLAAHIPPLKPWILEGPTHRSHRDL